MSAASSGPTRTARGRRASLDEREKCARILARLTPPAETYRLYRSRVDAYLDMVAPALRGPRRGAVVAFRLRRSQLFGGLDYLVAYVDDEWLRRIAPECDAIASPMSGRRAENLAGLQLPPFVFLPESKRRTRSAGFGSVVEHEFVHVNQALLAMLPEMPAARGADELLDYLAARTAVEFEACFVQEVRCPIQHPAALELSLGHWCLLRGYTQALEDVLHAVVELDARPEAVMRFLETLESSLPAVLGRAGADCDLSWFQERLASHFAIAVQNVAAPFPAAMDHPAFRAVALWLRTRLGTPDQPRTDTATGE